MSTKGEPARSLLAEFDAAHPIEPRLAVYVQRLLQGFPRDHSRSLRERPSSPWQTRAQRA